ncbi:MAG: hypothetical protein IPG18_11550 [Saprospiraceae bacterium]|nr:hypothetical protein [Saprospiraceae bacterium]MBK6565802.1 hypothetical protein [Saprospiraceae bacterium]
MNWKSIFIFIFLTTSNSWISGQCEFSLLPSGGACHEAIYLCGNELNGYEGRLPAGMTIPNDWVGLCNYSGSAENIVWFAFTTCSPTVTLRITPSNCNTNAGIQAGLFKNCGVNHSVDCSPVILPSVIGAVSTFDLTWNGFIPGNIAYFFIDGMAGCICDYKVEVIEGVEISPAVDVDPNLLDDGFVVGQNEISCEDSGDTLSYSMVLPTCLMNYVENCYVEKINILDSVCFVWNVDHVGSGSYYFVNNDSVGTNVDIVFNGTATDEFRIHVDVNIHPFYGGGCAKGDCGDVQDLLVKIKPVERDTTFIEICPNESVFLCNTNVATNAILECMDPTDFCKTLVYDVRLKPMRINDLGVQYQCVGDYFEFGGVQYFNSGVYNIPDPVECDLTHRFEVRNVVLNTLINNGIRQLDCKNEFITLSATTISDFPNDVRYEWSHNNQVMGTSSSLIVNKPGRYIVRVMIKNAFVDCTSSDFVDVTLNIEKPVCTFTVPKLNCRTKSGIVNYNANSILTNLRWTNPLGNVVTSNSLPVDSLAASTGVSVRFRAERTDNGCKIDTLIGITSDFIKPDIEIAGDGDLTCERLKVPLKIVTNLAWDSIRWIKDNLEFLIQDVDYYNVEEKGNYNAFIRASRNGCTNENSKTINEDRIYPIIDLGENRLWYCNTKSLDITPLVDRGDNFQYQWFQRNGGEINGSLVEPDVTINRPGTFYLQVGNTINGCKKIDTIQIVQNVDVPEEIVLQRVDPLCFGESNGILQDIEIIGGIAPYRVAVNGVELNADRISGLNAGIYELEVKDKYECVYKDTFELIDPELLTIDPIEDITVSFNETSSIEVFTNYDLSEIKEIIWRNTSGEIVGNGPVYFFDNLVSQSYEVEVININGCFVKTRVNVIVDNEVKFIISNVIKIGTGQESKIVIRKNNIPANLKNVSVYDRWGSKVFTTPQAIYMAGPEVLELDWNGNFNGSELQQGVYILMMEFQDFFGNQKKITTDITVIK